MKKKPIIKNGLIIFLNIIVLLSVSLSFAQARDTELSEFVMKEGLKAYLEGDFEKAETFLKDALEYNRFNKKAENGLLQVYLFQGKKHFKNKNYRTSRRYFQKVIEIESDNQDALTHIKKLDELEERRGELKDYQKVEKSSKSGLEKELADEHQKDKIEGKDTGFATVEDKLKSLEEKEKQYERIIVETGSSGAIEQESLDEFIATLKEIKSQEKEKQLSIIEKIEQAQKEKEEALKRERDKREKSEKSSQIVIYILIAVIVLILVLVGFIIIRAYQNYKTKQEVKDSKMMDMFYQLSQSAAAAQGAAQIGGSGTNPKMLAAAGADPEEEIIEIPNSRLLKIHHSYTVSKMNRDLESETTRIKIDALVACYFHDADRMNGLVDYWISRLNDRPNMVSGVLWACTVVEDMSVFNTVYKNRSHFDLSDDQVVKNIFRCFGHYLFTKKYRLESEKRDEVISYLKDIDEDAFEKMRAEQENNNEEFGKGGELNPDKNNETIINDVGSEAVNKVHEVS